MKYPCDVILDLIVPVKDGVASQQSSDAVLEHIAGCDACHAAYESYSSAQEPLPETADRKILGALRRSLLLSRIVLFAGGLLLGLLLFQSAEMFYNLLIMPAVGLLGYFIWKRHWYWSAFAVFILSYLWHFAAQWAAEGLGAATFTAPLFYSIIYTVLALTGAAAGMLLQYAFGKE